MPVEIQPFFHKNSNTFCYVVSDSSSNIGAVIDSCLDFDIETGRTNTDHADGVINYIKNIFDLYPIKFIRYFKRIQFNNNRAVFSRKNTSTILWWGAKAWDYKLQVLQARKRWTLLWKNIWPCERLRVSLWKI